MPPSHLLRTTSHLIHLGPKPFHFLAVGSTHASRVRQRKPVLTGVFVSDSVKFSDEKRHFFANDVHLVWKTFPESLRKIDAILAIYIVRHVDDWNAIHVL